MAPLIQLLLATAALFLLSISALFAVQKNRWQDAYQLRRRRWMPDWCSTCFTLWFSWLPALGLALYLGEPLVALAPLLVPGLFTIYNGRYGN